MKIFVVEDDQFYASALEHHLSKNPDYEVSKFFSGKDALENLYQQPSIITIDYSLPDYKGEELLKKIKKALPSTAVIVISSQKEINTAITLLKSGAFDYIVKDDDSFDRAWNSVRLAADRNALVEEIKELKEEIRDKYDFSNLIKGNSKAIESIFTLMKKAAKTNINVSVTGETGTGKELVAQAIHKNSERAKKPFVTVNMAAIPKELIESELFGHEKGAFTGATGTRIGKFEEAHGGTIFLDEIGELEINLQAKLLRVLQESEVVKVGGNKKVKIDVRIITATHKNLGEEVASGNFREDLFYRLMGLPIQLPPLRERAQDVVLLSEFFLKECAKKNGLGNKKLHKDAKDKLMGYSFPGNVRELKSVVELAYVMSDDEFVKAEDITFNTHGMQQSLLTVEKSMKEYTSEIIHHFLKKYDNNVLLVAKKLQIGKSTIYQMLKEEKE